MTSRCYVSAADHRAYWLGVIDPSIPARLAWNGVNQRSGSERRVIRDRRGESAAGRRYRLSDRRRSGGTK